MYKCIDFLSGSEENSTFNPLDAGNVGLIPGLGMIPWRIEWQSTPLFLPGESHGQKSLAGFSPWGHKESDTAEVTEYTCTHIQCNIKSKNIAPENP